MSGTQVLFHHEAGPWLQEEFRKLNGAGLDVAVCPVPNVACLEEHLPATEVLWHVLEPVTADMVARAARLRLIQKIGVGVNTIDLEAAKDAGVRVCNMPGTNSRAVAELTLALMLAALRRLGEFDRATRAGQGWAMPAGFHDSLSEIGGKRVGLVGFGAVPAILAPILTAMGADVAYTAREPKETPARLQTLDQLLAESDILSLHLPLTPETANLIDAAALRRMKPGVVFVNTARGGLIDQTALCEALRTRHVAAAGLDVFADEPIPENEPLRDLPNVVMTPHIAWLTRETMARSITVAVENCRRLQAGEPLLHQVV